MGWTIFTFIDFLIGLMLLDLMATTVPPEKLPRLRKARTVTLVLLILCGIVLAWQIARRYWLKA